MGGGCAPRFACWRWLQDCFASVPCGSHPRGGMGDARCVWCNAQLAHAASVHVLVGAGGQLLGRTPTLGQHRPVRWALAVFWAALRIP